MVLMKSLKFLLRQILPRKVIFDALDRKLAFLTTKETDFKKSQIFHFSKGVSPLFCAKI